MLAKNKTRQTNKNPSTRCEQKASPLLPSSGCDFATLAQSLSAEDSGVTEISCQGIPASVVGQGRGARSKARDELLIFFFIGIYFIC